MIRSPQSPPAHARSPSCARSGKDLWLAGGGKIIAAALDAGLIDDVIVSIHPLLLGGGVPLAAPPAARTSLALVGERCYPSGLVQLSYRADRN